MEELNRAEMSLSSPGREQDGRGRGLRLPHGFGSVAATLLDERVGLLDERASLAEMRQLFSRSGQRAGTRPGAAPIVAAAPGDGARRQLVTTAARVRQLDAEIEALQRAGMGTRR